MIHEKPKLWYCNAGCDSRWTWRGTLPQRMQAMIDELAWHFAFAAEPQDILLSDLAWPESWRSHLIDLGLSPPQLLAKASVPHRDRQLSPFAWDEEAESLARELGLSTPHPDLETVRQVNGRHFSLGLEQALGQTRAGWEVDQGQRLLVGEEVAEALQRRQWREGLLKAEHGQSGQGNLRVSLDNPESLRAAQALLKRSGSAVLESWHALSAEYAWLYELDASGQRHQARGHRLLTTGEGGFSGLLVAPEGALPADIAAAFEDAAQAVSQALQASGYWGPVGQDGYWHQASEGPRFRPLSDLNVRHTMAAPGHGLSRRLGNRHVALGLLSARERDLPSDEGERQRLLGDVAFDPATRIGAVWLTPGSYASGQAALRQTLLISTESEADYFHLRERLPIACRF